MTFLFLVIAALVILGAALAFTGRWGTGISPTDRAPAPIVPSAGEWDSARVTETKFRVALRGYRMEDVDAVLASLAEQLRSAEGSHAEHSHAEEADQIRSPSVET